MTDPTQEARLIDIHGVRELVPKHVSTIYRLMKSGKFPRQVKVGGSALWRYADIVAWVASLEASP